MLTLALGIGATTAIFSVVHAVVLKPFPFAEPDRVLHIFTTWKEARGSTSVGNFDYLDSARRTEHFAAAALRSLNLADEGRPSAWSGARVTSSFFHVFGVPQAHGRGFTDDEDQPGRAQVVVLSHRLWQRRFPRSDRVVGRTIRMNGVPLRSRGRDACGVRSVHDAAELWVPDRVHARTAGHVRRALPGAVRAA